MSVLSASPAMAQSLDELKAENAKLKAENAKLKKQLEDLSKKSPNQAKTTQKPAKAKVVSIKGWGKTTWGMTRKQVRKLYPKVKKEEGMLVFQKRTAGLKSYVGFQFLNDKLVRVSVLFAERYTNKNKYAQNFEDLKELLAKKYGEPTRAKYTWSDDLYKNDPNNIGMALALGHLTLVALWETPNTGVALVCSGGKYKVTMGLQYTDKTSTKALDSKAENQKLDDL